MKYYCENCGTEITTKRMKFPACPICLNATILLHQPALVDMERLAAEAYKPIEVPAWETTGQYQKRTGKTLPDNAAVYFLRKYCVPLSEWEVVSYGRAKVLRDDIWSRNLTAEMYIVYANSDLGCPPIDWEPEETIAKEEQGGEA